MRFSNGIVEVGGPNGLILSCPILHYVPLFLNVLIFVVAVRYCWSSSSISLNDSIDLLYTMLFLSMRLLDLEKMCY